MAFDIVFQFFLFMQFCIKEPDGTAVTALCFVQGKMDVRQHVFCFLLRFIRTGRNRHAAIDGQLIIDAPEQGCVFNLMDQSFQALLDHGGVGIPEKEIEAVFCVAAEKLVCSCIPVCDFFNLAQKLIGFFPAEYLCKERKLADRKRGHTSAAALQSLCQTLSEA